MTCKHCKHWMHIDGIKGACFVVLVVIDSKETDACEAFKERQ